jgi:hypothetical protein
MCPRSTFALGPCAFAALTILAGPNTTLGAEPKLASFSRWDAAALERARAGAARRIGEPECQKLLTDFKDPQGRPLKEVLETVGLSAGDYLQTIPFRDGSSLRVCQNRGILLAVKPGIRAVYVCTAGGGVSRLAQLQDPWVAESVVIHEMLHTLGLGENPPTSVAITHRVKARCRP